MDSNLKTIRPLLAALISVGLLWGCGAKKETLFTGKTMGTTYHIKVVSNYFTSVAHLKKKIDLCLEGINHSMSTFQPDSEISRFNAMQTTDKPFHASEDFYDVMSLAKKIYQQSHGAWDGTVDPLVNLWGFGRAGMKYELPDPKEVERELAEVGFDLIEFLPNNSLKKRHPKVRVDLASIAKGYGVDQVTNLLKQNSMNDFLVEIGGEVYAFGRRKDGRKWRVGINEPRKDAPLDAVYAVVELEDRGFATSGDYRNFIEIKGRRYSHVIDPHTGWPVENGVVSVSVLAEECALADGLATAIMVLGPQKGLEVVNRINGVEALILVEKQGGKLERHRSKGFDLAAQN